MTFEDILREIYYDVRNPASFSSVDKLYNEARTRNNRIKRADVEKFLSGEIAYTLHRRIVRRFTRNPIISRFHTELAQADLIDVSRYAKQNGNNKFILTLIDVFSKYAYAVVIKNKSGLSVSAALTKIFESGYRPGSLQTDQGKEFINKNVQKTLKDFLVRFYVARNERIKCAVVERFQRTLMTRLHKYFTAKGTLKYLGVLQDLVNSYNKTWHRTIRMTPAEAVHDVNEKDVFRNAYGFKNTRQMLRKTLRKTPRLHNVGQHVRVPKHKDVFAKGYRQNFTDQIYTVNNRNKYFSRPVYSLTSYDGERVRGTFYPEELVPVSNNDIYRVHVLGQRIRGKRKQVRVRYHNFPDHPPEWISASALLPLS